MTRQHECRSNPEPRGLARPARPPRSDSESAGLFGGKTSSDDTPTPERHRHSESEPCGAPSWTELAAAPVPQQARRANRSRGGTRAGSALAGCGRALRPAERRRSARLGERALFVLDVVPAHGRTGGGRARGERRRPGHAARARPSPAPGAARRQPRRLLGPIGYDVFRVPFEVLGGLRLLAPIDSDGVLLLDAARRPRPRVWPGWSFHFANGIGFGNRSWHFRRAP